MTIEWARIDTGVVVETTATDPTGRFHPSLVWVAVPDGVTVIVGQLYSSGAGFTAAPAPATVVPTQVTLFQAKAAMLGRPGIAGGSTTMLDDVNAWIASQGGVTALAWANSPTVTRGSTMVTALAAHFSWSSATLDALFTSAAAISA